MGFGVATSWVAFSAMVACSGCSSTSDASKRSALDGGALRGGPETGPEGPLPTPTLSAEPRNGTTGFSGNAWKLTAYQGFGAPDRSWLSGIRIESASGVVGVQGSFTNETDTGYAYVLAWDGPLAPGWYDVHLPAPRGTYFSESVESPRAVQPLDDGTYDMQFRVGSHPVVLAVAACESNDATLPKLIVSFSEPVVLPETSPFGVVAGGAAPDCAPNGPYHPADGFAEYTCSPAMASNAEIVVSVGPGITSSADSTPLAPTSVSLPPAAAGVACRTYRLDGPFSD